MKIKKRKYLQIKVSRKQLVFSLNFYILFFPKLQNLKISEEKKVQLKIKTV